MVPQYRKGCSFTYSCNTINQKDEKLHTTGLDDTSLPYIKIKISEIPLEKKLNTATL